jgi:MFS-type transporter involved in bile tolerance (Atg22 family)
LLSEAGYDPAISTPANPQPCSSGDCYLKFAGTPQSINSIVLKTNGISFALQCVLFLLIGSFADYGWWRRWILVGWTVASWAFGFGWLGVHDPTKWQAATALYILGCPFVSNESKWQ